MKYGATNKWAAACLGLALAAAGVRAQQAYTPGWSGYAGGDYGSDSVYALATDSQTNTYIAGFLDNFDLRNVANQTVSVPPDNGNCEGLDGFVAKVNASGGLVWYVLLGDSEYDRMNGLAIHTNGTVYAAGLMNRTFEDFGTDARLTALSGTTGADLWSQSIGTFNSTNGFNAVAVASNGDIYAVGYTTVTGLISNVSGYPVDGVTYGTQYKGGTDAFVAKYAPDGSRLWLHYLGGTNADTATACTLGPDGSVYVGGETRSPGWATVPGGSPSPSNPDGFLVKLTASGTNVWSAFIGGGAADAVTALARDPATEALYLGGSTESANFMAGAIRQNSPTAGGTDGFALRLTDLGATFQTNWCRFFGGSGSDGVAALSLQTAGTVAVGGSTSSGGWLPQAGASAFGGIQDGFVSRLSADGAPLWSAYVGAARSDTLHALAGPPGLLLSAGTTFSPGWVSGGFWDEWSKDTDWDDLPDYDANLSYGFIATWSSEPGVPPTITSEPADATVQEGERVAFTVTATGYSPLTYRWFRNGAPLAGPASNVYVVAAAAVTNNGDTYSCLVSNFYGTATSRAATLTVIAKGTLTVALSPVQAVSQGARWSINGGATWLASGFSTNVPPGAYTVTFTNLTGWLAPAALSGVQVTSGATNAATGVYTAVLPSAVRAISGTNVTVTVRAPAGLSTWQLVETLPAGLTPTNITAGGVWNSAARTLTFTGVEATTNALSYLVICASSGLYTLGGTVTPLPANAPVAVTGDTQILKANFVRTITGNIVSITVTQPLPTVRWHIYEYPPETLAFTILSGPVFEFDVGYIDWTKRGVGETVSYEVTGAPGTYMLSGEGLIGTALEPIFGDSVLTIAGAETPPPNILAFAPLAGTGTGLLTFTSVVSQAYMILTNATLHATNAWAECLPPVTGDAGVTQREVPMTGPRLFYRVRVTQ